MMPDGTRLIVLMGMMQLYAICVLVCVVLVGVRTAVCVVYSLRIKEVFACLPSKICSDHYRPSQSLRIIHHERM